MQTYRTEDIHLRDPFILPVDTRYYLYGTRCEIQPGQPAGFDIYTSENLHSWSGPFPIFNRPDDFWADRDFWAPEVHKYQE